jgi:sugar phosphate isomerase/epimerase
MEQSTSRRGFLGAAIGTGAAAALAPEALAGGRHGRKHGRHGHHKHGGGGRVPKDRRGIQLYTLRRIMERSQADARNVLRFLGRNGYTEVETAGHYGWTAQQFRSELRRAGLRAVAGHDGPDFNFPAGWQDAYRTTLDYAAELGQKFTGFAWFPGPYDSLAKWHDLAAKFNEAGDIAQEFDLQFFYHNHDFEFLNKQPDGSPVYDILLEETDRELVEFELDLFWITEGGGNGVEYLSADPRRFMGYHVKDHVWGDRRKEDGSDEADWEDAGPGMLDFPDLFDAGDRGDKHYFIEHDWPQLSHPDDEEAEYKTALNGIRYLDSVRW